MTRQLLSIICVMGLAASPALAQFDSGSDGSDGQFYAAVDTTINLAQAVTASWDTPSPAPGYGVYDTAQWAVVFKYTTIYIPAGVTVTFTNHPSGAPVVWLAQSDVTIDGTVNLNGTAGSSGVSYAEPGAGGFAGGRAGAGGLEPSGGFGPGGAQRGGSYGRGGGYGTVGHNGADGSAGGTTYGNPQIIPLIGGSGGSGCTNYIGGGGGGAILIASSSNITLNGGISAGGGNGLGLGGGGSGGAIRLIANNISGSGSLGAGAGGSNQGSAHGNGGSGRIRMEADSLIDFGGSVSPTPSLAIPGTVFPPSTAPTLRITQIAGQPAPSDPDAGIGTVDVAISDASPVTIDIEATYIPLGTTVQVRIVPQRGDVITAVSTALVGSQALSTATAQVPFALYRSEIQLKANLTP